jgi:hypothetical protein
MLNGIFAGIYHKTGLTFYFCLSEQVEQAVVAYFLKRLFKTTITKAYFIEDKLVVTGSADWRNYKFRFR